MADVVTAYLNPQPIAPRVRRDPLCACCRRRHKIGAANAYYDVVDDCWRCARCWTRVDADGDCQTPKCCGN